MPKRSINRFQPISIIIAARNEQENLPILIDSLRKIDYPEDKFEIIIANDRSTDNTASILSNAEQEIKNLKVVTIKSGNPSLVGKKGALDAAVKLSQFNILAFTDADCIPAARWLQEIDAYFTDDIDFMAGYSPLLNKKPLLGKLKNLERASIFAVTAGSFGIHWAITCTARNMIYRKDIFNKINGFAGIGHIQSGDDDLMLLKMSPQIRKFNFMFTRDSIVPSIDKDDLKSQIQLESRRASKWKYYPNSIKILSLFVFIYYVIFILVTGLTIVGNIHILNYLVGLLLKIFSEFLLLFIFLLKVKNLDMLIVFPLAEIVYIPYFIYFGLKGTLGKYKWKT